MDPLYYGLERVSDMTKYRGTRDSDSEIGTMSLD